MLAVQWVARIALFALVWGVAGLSRAETVYRLTVLPGPPGTGTVYPRALSDRGHVTGYFDAGSGQTHAFLVFDGVFRDIGPPEGGPSSGVGVNNLGHVTGTMGSLERAFLYKDGVLSNIGTLRGQEAFGAGINDAGQIAGYTGRGLTGYAFLYAGGVISDLGSLGGVYGRAALAINSAGHVTGMSSSSATEYHAFLFRDGKMSDLGALPGGLRSQGNAINNADDVAGWSWAAGTRAERAVLFRGGKLIDLAAIGKFDLAYSSACTGINDAGDVVGIYSSSTGGAFRYRDGIVKDLYAMLEPLTRGNWTIFGGWLSINASGQIVGAAYDPQAKVSRMVLLTPLPEPASLSDSDRIFNYLEARFPQYTVPTLPASATGLGYYYRYYKQSGNYLGTKDGQVYYLVPSISADVQLLGSVETWLATAKAAGY